ncbi:uncharacterized protein LOC126904439 [Daktulosphaira vitifoliae]|uniref:uncharacterized protein LOC126904439 n=1 Tax=Daktulosphaira vitifoliae TaxID=58002 RepID=UPI0021A97B68|nr:uncharacterized protein LOC126904439 [Daktulosphaira vitifoliae]
MYFYIFIVMYLTGSLSNAILFTFPPLDEKSKLNSLAVTRANVLFHDYKCNDKGMELKYFKRLWNLFKPIHKLEDIDIETLFIDEVKNKEGFMKLSQFLHQTLNIVQIVESKLKTIYEKYQYQDNKMTKKNFFEAIKEFKIIITEDDANEMIPGEQDFSFTEFRQLFAQLYHHELNKKLMHMTEDGIIIVLNPQDETEKKRSSILMRSSSIKVLNVN